MQYQSTSSYGCRYSCSSSSPLCSCHYSYCQPRRNSNSSHYPHYSHTTTIHHHYHYSPHSHSSSTASQSFCCQQFCNNVPTCISFSPTKNQQSCNYKSSPSSVSSCPIASTSSTFTDHRHQQRQHHDPKKYKMLTHSIQELIQSERDYVDDLYIMVEICLAVMHQQKWVSARHVAIMSRNSSDILAFHQRILASFYVSTHQSVELKCQAISQTFLDHQAEFMALYEDYCDGHSKAWNLCTEYRSKSEWPDFILQCQALIQEHQENMAMSSPSSSNKRIRFEDFLIKPIQRICRYQLLLKEIVKHANSTPSSSSSTSTSSSSYHSILTQAFNCMHHIATEIDRQNEKKEYQERTSRFIQRLESDWRLSKKCVAELGSIIISGALDIQYYMNKGDAYHPMVFDSSPHPHETTSTPPSFPSPPPSPINAASVSNNQAVKSRYLGCFVFASYIIMVQVKKQTLYEAKHWFPLHLVDLVDQDNDNNDFMLQHGEHIFICTASCTKEKQTWIEKIRLTQQSLYNKQHHNIGGIVSSLSNHPFSSTRFDISHHQRPQLRSSTTFFSNEPQIYHYHPHRSTRNELLPASSSSPSLLLAAAENTDHHTSRKKNRSLSTHLTSSSSGTKTTNPSLSSPSSPIFPTSYQNNHVPATDGKQQPPRRHSSLDLFTMASHNLTRVSLHFKSHHRNAMRDAVDQRIRDVCTRDYLSSRARHIVLDRKLSTNSSPLPPLAPPPTAMSSPLVAATSSVASFSPSPSPSTPLQATATSSSFSSSSLLVPSSPTYHPLQNRIPSPTLYPSPSSPLQVCQASSPCRSRRSNPKSPLTPTFHNDTGDNDNDEKNSDMDPSRKTSGTTMTEIPSKKKGRRVSLMLQSLWRRLRRAKTHKHASITKIDDPSHFQTPHRSTVSLPLTNPISPTVMHPHPMKIQEEDEEVDTNQQLHDILHHPATSNPIPSYSDFHLYQHSLNVK
ncbi:hypothetical protein BCR42DRAFT_453182 [Absidia repens]|uniref:DH domain-containing protein n=1 Tax=Absidia repens TaxID=90262 RepID=A0A1X2ICH7_9FUNG|nr:hypothetical protein BCR42DRAFT_453182 [Absidia repens]